LRVVEFHYKILKGSYFQETENLMKQTHALSIWILNSSCILLYVRTDHERMVKRKGKGALTLKSIQSTLPYI
jgi:hypothetical protein